MKRFVCLFASLALAGCASNQIETPEPVVDPGFELSAAGIATMFARLPMGLPQLNEVYDAVGRSCGNGYDEEYMLDSLMAAPGAGVGPSSCPTGTPSSCPTRSGVSASSSYEKPLRDLVREYVSAHARTRAGAEDILLLLEESGYQIYWPYSEDWDGSTFPVITYDPGYGAESNVGWALAPGPDGTACITDTLTVTEAVALTRPVWVINSNSDAAFTPLELFTRTAFCEMETGRVSQDRGRPWPRERGAAKQRRLMLKSFKMLRQYDSWFGGASEFFVKCGSVEGWTSSTDAELKLFNIGVTDFMIVVKRKYVGKELPFDAIMVTDFTSQLDKLAFLIVEDDGGARTNWKCQAMVKIQSKSYGVELDIPYNEKDDIVWRGQLSARFFEEEDTVTGRFGDVVCKFELE